MKKTKNIESELKRLNIPFRKKGKLYWLYPQFVFGEYEPDWETEREVWRHINLRTNGKGSWRKHVKQDQREKERMFVKENLAHDRWEDVDYCPKLGNHRDYD